MIVYHLKSCDRCRRALREIRAAGKAPETVEIREDGVPRAALERFHAAFGDRLVNRRSTTWRGLSEAERARDPLALLADHPTLMTRPVIDAGGDLHLGWDESVRAAVLG